MLLDTDILVDVARGHPAATAWINALPALPDVPGFAAMEVIRGCQNAAELRAAQTFLKLFRIVWPSEDDLHRALTEYMPLYLSHGLGILDALIASTAIGRGFPLATFNVRHFRAVPGLVIVQPYTR